MYIRPSVNTRMHLNTELKTGLYTTWDRAWPGRPHTVTAHTTHNAPAHTARAGLQPHGPAPGPPPRPPLWLQDAPGGRLALGSGSPSPGRGQQGAQPPHSLSVPALGSLGPPRGGSCSGGQPGPAPVRAAGARDTSGAAGAGAQQGAVGAELPLWGCHGACAPCPAGPALPSAAHARRGGPAPQHSASETAKRALSCLPTSATAAASCRRFPLGKWRASHRFRIMAVGLAFEA